MGLQEHLESHRTTHSDTGAPKMPFLAKKNQNVPSQPRVDRRSNKVKIHTK